MSGRDGAPLQRVESFQWPAGHVGHLSENQRGALDRFKELSESKGYYKAANGDTPATHDDETLLRYLRARKFVPQEAFGQFKDTEDWRSETQLEHLYETIDVQEYEQTRRLYPQWTGRRDKRGIPFYVFEVGAIDSKDVNASSSSDKSKDAKSGHAASKTPRKMLRLFALYENLCRFVLPLCSAIPNRNFGETPVSQSSNIVDISKVGFAKFWSLRNHMSDASTLATAHYPETLDRIFVVGAPSFFPTVWQWAQKWFDPITVSKIFILSDKNMASTLAKYVDMSNVPKKYGGTLDWKFGDMPYLEPNIAQCIRWKEDVEQKGHRTVPIGPIKWQYDENGDLVMMAIGTEHGKPRRKVIASLHPEAGIARLSLSPGRSDEYPPASLVAAAAQRHNSIPRQSEDTFAADAYASQPPTFSPPDSRQGTSSTRFEQQKGTHTEGEMAYGTPEIKIDSQGEKQGIMEPNTVGQAPKEHPTPEPEEPAGPGLVERAQDMAGSVYQSASAGAGAVLGAVGLGGHAAHEQQAVAGGQQHDLPERPRRTPSKDAQIDAMDGQNVEEFLRSKTMSQQPGKGSAGGR